MTAKGIEIKFKEKQDDLLEKYFGNLFVPRNDFLEEITGKHIMNKAL